jgi:UDP-GlcNAc:undecaprenyl-phosphate GlcNAc-1-phosphate transferase
MFLILTMGVLSVLLALILTPITRDRLGRLGFLDHPDGVRKKHATAVPRVGGIAIVLAYVLTFAIAFALPFSYTSVLRHALPHILHLVLAGSVVFATGVLDDRLCLSAWKKLAGIASAAVLAYAAGIRVDIHILHGLPAWPRLEFALTVIWLIGCTNAFNLIDGMDGLAAGVGLVATVTLSIAALTQGNLPLALATMPLAGCLLGFLRYNFNGASVFLGDSGSLLIGFLLGCYGALWSEKSVTLVALTVPLLAVSIPLLDVVLSILRRYLRNRPIFEADRGHIHHKLLERGLSPTSAVLTIYAFCGGVALLSLVASSLRNQFSGLIVVVFCPAAWMAIQQLRYTEFATAGRMFLQGGFRRIIDFETRLAEFEKTLARSTGIEECWIRIRSGSREFGFQGVRMNFEGMVFEDFERGNSKRLWELRIPLAEARDVNFFHDVGIETSSLVLSAFATAVENGMRTCMERLFLEAAATVHPVEVVKIAPIVKRYYAYPQTTAASTFRDASKASRAASAGVLAARPPNTSTATAPA